MTQPHRHAWTADGQPLRLVEQTVATPRTHSAGDAKARACSGLLARWVPPGAAPQAAIGRRCVAGRPVRGGTTPELAWCGERAAALGKTALRLVWDQASWHGSAQVRTWRRAHNPAGKAAAGGVPIRVCPLPPKRPWLNPIEPQGVHGKRAVVEPDGLLPAARLEEPVCDYSGCPLEPHLTIPQEAA